MLQTMEQMALSSIAYLQSLFTMSNYHRLHFVTRTCKSIAYLVLIGQADTPWRERAHVYIAFYIKPNPHASSCSRFHATGHWEFKIQVINVSGCRL